MRYVVVRPDGVLDSETGEIHDRLELPMLLSNGEGGVICGRNLYPILSSLADAVRNDEGWTMTVHAQHQRNKEDRVHGIIYYSRLSYRSPKIGCRERRKRPPAIKWLVLNMELFSESLDIEEGARALVHLAYERGIKPRYSPGTFGGALLRASPAWESERNPAPRFISEAARPNLPGNLYALRSRYTSASRALYIDQSSSHHTIASSIPLPHPHYLRARGRFRAVETNGELPQTTPYWLRTPSLLDLHGHVGVIVATLEISRIPDSKIHLYPSWCKKSGTRQVWVWTPELRLFDRYIRLMKVSAALTSYVPDPALREYAEWCIAQAKAANSTAKSFIKPAMLAAYGMLAVRSRERFTMHSIHGRPKPSRAERVVFPLVDGDVYRSTVERKRTPVIQNVVARGVIEAETSTRSLELARTLEAQKIKVIQIYADGIIAETDQVPLLPAEWRVSAELSDVEARTPNSIVSKSLVKLPGIPNGRRTSAILTKSTKGGD